MEILETTTDTSTERHTLGIEVVDETLRPYLTEKTQAARVAVVDRAPGAEPSVYVTDVTLADGEPHQLLAELLLRLDTYRLPGAGVHVLLPGPDVMMALSQPPAPLADPAELLHAVADAILAGCPSPAAVAMSAGYAAIQMRRDEPGSVELLLAHLGADETTVAGGEVVISEVLGADTDAPFRERVANLAWQGWSLRIWAAESVQTATGDSPGGVGEVGPERATPDPAAPLLDSDDTMVLPPLAEVLNTAGATEVQYASDVDGGR